MKENTKLIERPQRLISHALVEIKKYKHLPFFCYSAVLLDLSFAGFKVEFTSELHVKPGNKYWLFIPLKPLGIYSQKKILCRIECRWFDNKRYRAGGVFITLDKTQRLIIEQILDTLENKRD